VGPQLAIGGANGSLLIFRRDTRKKQLITGKHAGAILCGDWSRDNTLALGGADVSAAADTTTAATAPLSRHW